MPEFSLICLQFFGIPLVLSVILVVAMLCIIQRTILTTFVVETVPAAFRNRDSSLFVFLPVGRWAGAVHTGNTDILRASTLFHFLLSLSYGTIYKSNRRESSYQTIKHLVSERTI